MINYFSMIISRFGIYTYRNASSISSSGPSLDYSKASNSMYYSLMIGA